MTNFEKWKDKIATIRSGGHCVAVVNGEPVACQTVRSCELCDLHMIPEGCNYGALQWAASEYVEPEPKLTKREKEFLECFELQSDLIISRASISEMLFIVSNDSHFSQRISKDMFQFIKPYESWTVEHLMKLEVEK